MKAVTEAMPSQDTDLLVLDGSLPCMFFIHETLDNAHRVLHSTSDYTVYKTKDGRFISVGALENRFYAQLL